MNTDYFKLFRDIGGKPSSKHLLKLMFMSSKMFGKVFFWCTSNKCINTETASDSLKLWGEDVHREPKGMKILLKMSRVHYIRCKVNAQLLCDNANILTFHPGKNAIFNIGHHNQHCFAHSLWPRSSFRFHSWTFNTQRNCAIKYCNTCWIEVTENRFFSTMNSYSYIQCSNKCGAQFTHQIEYINI